MYLTQDGRWVNYLPAARPKGYKQKPKVSLYWKTVIGLVVIAILL